MPNNLEFLGFEPVIAIGEAGDFSQPSPSDVLVQCLVALPGTNDGAGNPMFAAKHVRLSDLLEFVASSKGGVRL